MRKSAEQPEMMKIPAGGMRMVRRIRRRAEMGSELGMLAVGLGLGRRRFSGCQRRDSTLLSEASVPLIFEGVGGFKNGREGGAVVRYIGFVVRVDKADCGRRSIR